MAVAATAFGAALADVVAVSQAQQAAMPIHDELLLAMLSLLLLGAIWLHSRLGIARGAGVLVAVLVASAQLSWWRSDAIGAGLGLAEAPLQWPSALALLLLAVACILLDAARRAAVVAAALALVATAVATATSVGTLPLAAGTNGITPVGALAFSLVALGFITHLVSAPDRRLQRFSAPAGLIAIGLAGYSLALRLATGLDAAASELGAMTLPATLCVALLGAVLVQRADAAKSPNRWVEVWLPVVIALALGASAFALWFGIERDSRALAVRQALLELDLAQSAIDADIQRRIVALDRFTDRLQAVAPSEREALFGTDAAQMLVDAPYSQGIAILGPSREVRMFLGPSTMPMVGVRVDLTPDRVAAYDRADRTGRPVALGPVKLLGAPKGTPLGLLLIVPLGPRESGYALTSLRMAEWLAALLAPIEAELPLEVLAGPAGERVYRSASMASGGALIERRFATEGMQFTLRFDADQAAAHGAPLRRQSRLGLFGALLLALAAGLVSRYALVARRESRRASEALASERRAAEEGTLLRQRDALVGRLIEQSAAVLWRWQGGSERPASFVSENVSQWGYEAAEFVSRALSYRGVVHPDDVAPLEAVMDHAHRSGKDRFEATYRLRTANGAWVWVEERTVIERDTGGQPVGWHGLTLDISERRALADNQARLLEEVQRRNEDLSHFAFVASHDLQEPLRKARLFIDQVMTRDAIAPNDLDRLQRADGALRRMQEIVEAVGGYVRLGDALPSGRVDLDAVIADVLRDLDDRAHAAGAVIETGDLGRVRGSQPEIYQLFLNLVSNSLKFRAADRAPRIVIGPVACHPDGSEDGMPSMAKFVIEDNGIGFDPEFRDAIFRPFKRLHARERYDGTGMGLAIVKRIVERHGGRIEAESAGVGAGACFRIELPR